MSSRAGRAQRVGRGVAAAAIATFLATVSHGAVDAALPSAANIAVALCLAAPVCVLLAGRTMSWARLGAAVVLSQALFHGILAVDLTGVGTAATAGHHGTGSISGAAATAVEHASHAPGMWVAHALAAAVTILALGRGEQVVRSIARFFVRAVRALEPVPGFGPADATTPAPAPLLLPRALSVLSTMRHRGPPLAA